MGYFYMPGTLLPVIDFLKILKPAYLITIIISISQLNKWSLREIKHLSQGHTTRAHEVLYVYTVWNLILVDKKLKKKI